MSEHDYGVLHPNGEITVTISGHPFTSLARARRESEEFDGVCDACDGGTHVVVSRALLPWQRTEP